MLPRSPVHRVTGVIIRRLEEHVGDDIHRPQTLSLVKMSTVVLALTNKPPKRERGKFYLPQVTRNIFLLNASAKNRLYPFSNLTQENHEKLLGRFLKTNLARLSDTLTEGFFLISHGPSGITLERHITAVHPTVQTYSYR